MKVYTLHAGGPSVAGYFANMTFHKAFRTREAAEAAKPLFSELCLTDMPGSLAGHLLKVTEMRVREYEMDDEDKKEK